MDLEKGPDGLALMTTETFAGLSPQEVDELRRAHALIRTHPMRVMALRGADVQRLLGDPQLLQLPGKQYCAVTQIPEGRCRSFLETFMLMTNGPEHARLRGAFSRTFAHPVMRAKRAEVRAVADRVVADLPRGEAFDFLDLCASRLPAEMIAEVLGLPVTESRWFAREVYSLSRCLMLPYDLAAHDEIEASAEALYRFVEEAMDARRAAPRGDLLSDLATDDSARALEPEVLNVQVVGLILAGSDTTRSGFNALVALLLEDRARWEALRVDPSLIPGAVDEALRIAPPVGSTPRYAPAALSLSDGTEIPPGQVVGLSTLSAMRDEGQIDAPEAFDLRRKDVPRPHMVFGGGAHRCLGEMLARIELEEGLAALLDGAPGLEMVEAPRMLGLSGIRRSTPLIARIP